MNTGVKIAIYTASGLVLTVLANEAVKHANNGVGFLTSERRMAKVVLTSPHGRSKPQETVTKEDVEWWKSLDKSYRRNWYKAVWRTGRGKVTPTFLTKDGKRFNTLGGKLVK
jgi:hypothetical protein